MSAYDEWLDLLERQASLIDTFDSQINARRASGMNVALSLEALQEEIRLYRRMLDQAPIDVLLLHASTSAQSRHL